MLSAGFSGQFSPSRPDRLEYVHDYWLRGLRERAAADIFRAVIRFDSVSKNHGQQILFMEASAAVNRGEKVGLVGPNGSGKTTLFRLIVGEEQPDGGQMAV